MSQYFIPSLMFATLKAPIANHFPTLVISFCLLLLTGCSTPAQQQAAAQITALNNQRAQSPEAKTEPYLGGYNPSDPPRLSADIGYDPLNPELSNTVAIPFLSFLIIEPDPISKNAVPPDVERLIKARQYKEAINLINYQIKTNPHNVQIRFVKARLQIELRLFSEAKKTLIEITQQFPELPEPYNNLAAIAANQGNWIEARDYLELALKLRPSYAIASANLGEIYIRLGAQTYENAAKGVQSNQRQYTNRAKALLDILKPTSKKSAIPPKSSSGSESINNSRSTTTPLEGNQNSDQSTPKNQ